jgi:hypothetical protein
VTIKYMQYLDTADCVHDLSEFIGQTIAIDYGCKPPVLKLYEMDEETIKAVAIPGWWIVKEGLRVWTQPEEPQHYPNKPEGMPTRGAQLPISLHLVSSILNKALGFEEGTLNVVSVTYGDYARSVNFQVITEHPDFPLIREGCQFESLILHMRTIDVNGSKRVAFDGFHKGGE